MHRNGFFKKEGEPIKVHIKTSIIIKTLAFLNLSHSSWSLIKSQNYFNLQIFTDVECRDLNFKHLFKNVHTHLEFTNSLYMRQVASIDM